MSGAATWCPVGYCHVGELVLTHISQPVMVALPRNILWGNKVSRCSQCVCACSVYNMVPVVTLDPAAQQPGRPAGE